MGKSEATIESQALLQAVLDTAIDAIITINTEGVICSANRAVQRILGYKPDELIGKPVSMLMPEPYRSAHPQYIANYESSGQAKIIGIGREVMAQHCSGRLVPIDLAVSEIKLADRKLFTGIMRDMSERYEAEASLEQAREQLIQSERLAAIGQMVTGLAHESRNALQRSRACLDMLELDLAESPDQLDWIHRTKSALVELQTLYEEVRNYAAPIKLELSECSLGQIVQDVWRQLSDFHCDKELQLVVVKDTAPKCRCDRHRISQVVRNILENAILVTPPGHRIFVATSSVERYQQACAMVAIVDEGPGLDEVQREKIFDPFFTTRTKGTGLGMAISKRIVEAHAGAIDIGNGQWAPCNKPGAEIIFIVPERYPPPGSETNSSMNTDS